MILARQAFFLFLAHAAGGAEKLRDILRDGKLSSTDAEEPVSEAVSSRFNPIFEWLKWSKMQLGGGAFVAPG